MIGDATIVTNMLILLNVIFLLIIFAYYLIRIDKHNKILHADFIQGKWQRKGHDVEGNAWFIQYEFDGQNFQVIGQPDVNVAGKYQVSKEVENLLFLQPSHIQGTSDIVRNPIRIGIDKKAKQLTIDDRIFQRVGL